MRSFALFLLTFTIIVSSSFATQDSFQLLADAPKAASVSITLTERESESALLEYDLTEFDPIKVFYGGERYDVLTIEGEPYIGVEGGPALPTLVRMVLIPPQSGVSLNITNLETVIIDGINPLPFQPAENSDLFDALCQGSPAMPLGELYRDVREYSKSEFTSASFAELGRPAILRGYRLVPIKINPFRWNPATGELEVIKHISIELDYNSQENLVNVVENPGRVKPTKASYTLLSDLVMNPPAPPRDLDRSSGSILYVTGDWNDVANELNRLVEWRRRMGWSVTVHRTRNNQNRDAIRNEIREYYNSDDPPEYVVIVGDADGQYTMACHIHANVGNPYETDHPYSMLDGDDILPDVAVGRFIIDGVNNGEARLNTIVSKIIQYESEPFMGEGNRAGWQNRGAVVSADFNRNGPTTQSAMEYCRMLMLRDGFSRVSTLYATQQQGAVNPSQFISEQFAQSGISFFVFRGFLGLNGFNHVQVNQLNNERMLPLVILATCNTGDFLEHAYNQWSYTERFFYYGSGGSIGSIGTGGATHTYYNNVFAAGTMQGYFVDRLHHQGWVLMRGKSCLFRNYAERGDIEHGTTHHENWETHTYIYNLMGDPATSLWSDVPQDLSVVHQQTLRPSESHIEVNVAVREGEDEIPLEGALVCLYKSGVFQSKVYTDVQGRAPFDLNPEWTREGEIQLTVTGHNLRPYLADLAITEEEMFIGADGFEIDDDNQGSSSGDNDGIANPTERIELALDIRNYGTNTPNGALTVELTTDMPSLSVIEGNAQFQNAPQSGEAVIGSFVVEIGGGHPHGVPAVFYVRTQVGQQQWLSSVSIPIVGAKFEFVSLEWVQDPLDAGTFADAIITIKNVGGKDSPPIEGILRSGTETVDIPISTREFEPIEVNETRSPHSPYRLSAHPFHIRGSRADLNLVLTSDNGFVDNVEFSLSVNVPREGDPFGPDDYGYVCFDNTDENWFAMPVYNWIEIDPAHDGPGTNTELRDGGYGQDASIVMDLPFEFQYYGERYNQVTICSNGWMAMGDISQFNERHNRIMPGGLVLPAIIAPFWDDLIIPNDGGVYTWYSEEEDYFVVQWSRLRRMMQGQSPVETFQVIIYDPEFHPSFTGDGDIVFQYLQVEDHRAPADTYGDPPYATVGIGSPDMTTALTYSFWNELHPGAAPLEPELAIKFTTLLSFDTAYLHGRVYDAATNQPIEGALVQSTFGFWDLTDEQGMWSIPEILVDENSEYALKASKVFYNDSTIAEIRIAPEDTLRFDFGLLHPEFTLDFNEVAVEIEQENANDFWIPLRNTGNGTLTFSSKLEFRDVDPDRDALFDVFLQFDVTNTMVTEIVDEDTITRPIGNTYINGVVFVDSLFYVTGGGNRNRDIPAKVYRFTRQGEFVDSLSLPWIDNRGLRGVTYDGENIWGCHSSHVFKFDREMTLLDSFQVSPSIPVDVAVDPVNQTIYVCGVTGNIDAHNYQGELQASWNLSWDGQNLRKYGLAWYPGQPDSLNLLIFTTEPSTDFEVLFGFNPINGELQRLKDLTRDGADSPIGIDVSGRWKSSVWTLLTTVSHPNGDWVTVYELEPNTTWLTYSPVEGTLLAGQDTTFHVKVEAGMRPFDHYWVTLFYTMNADPGQKIIPISMSIVEESSIDQNELTPTKFALDQNYPNPFNAETIIRYSLPQNGRARLAIYDLQGRRISVLKDGFHNAGFYTASFNAIDLPNGVYFYKLESAGASTVRKMVLMK